MRVFQRRSGDVLHCESVPLPDIVRATGTPVFVYSRRFLEDRYAVIDRAFTQAPGPVRICYAVKANSSLSVLQVFAQLGAGFDIVSAGELARVLAAGGEPGSVVFSGVGKSTEELDFGLKAGIGCFNVESAQELERLGERARLLGRNARIAIRVNPDVDADTHPYISTGLKENKFGVPVPEARQLLNRAAAHPRLVPAGLACHIGSQISDSAPLLAALERLLVLTDQLAGDGIRLAHLDLGGGFGVRYRDEAELDVAAYGRAVAERLAGRELSLTLEPGRFLTANGGVLVTRIEYTKPDQTQTGHGFAIVDAAMNDLLRPALYQAWHDVERITPAPPEATEGSWDVVGPICESGDFLARNRLLALRPGDLLAVHGAGAYAMTLSSNYNSRPRAAEVLVDGSAFRVIRRRETIEDLLRGERLS